METNGWGGSRGGGSTQRSQSAWVSRCPLYLFTAQGCAAAEIVSGPIISEQEGPICQAAGGLRVPGAEGVLKDWSCFPKCFQSCAKYWSFCLCPPVSASFPFALTGGANAQICFLSDLFPRVKEAGVRPENIRSHVRLMYGLKSSERHSQYRPLQARTERDLMETHLRLVSSCDLQMVPAEVDSSFTLAVLQMRPH